MFCRLDIGEGKHVDLPDCPRSKLQKQAIKYLGPVCYFSGLHLALFYSVSTRKMIIMTLFWNFWPVMSLNFFSTSVLQQERKQYEYIVEDGKIVHKQSGDLLHTVKDSGASKWIFVMSTSKKLYAGEVTNQSESSLLVCVSFWRQLYTTLIHCKILPEKERIIPPF